MQNNKSNEYRYLSVSEFATEIGRSTTYVYNMIANNQLETVPFQRGKYNGYVIKVAK